MMCLKQCSLGLKDGKREDPQGAVANRESSLWRRQQLWRRK